MEMVAGESYQKLVGRSELGAKGGNKNIGVENREHRGVLDTET
jgi:hypothetical protein